MYSDIPDVDIMLRPSNCCESTGEEGRYGDPLIDRISDWQFRMKPQLLVQSQKPSWFEALTKKTCREHLTFLEMTCKQGKYVIELLNYFLS